MFSSTEKNILDDALNACRRSFAILLGFSLGTNILTLALPIYSLQVLDRVISSGNLVTLLMLSLVMIVCFVVLSLISTAKSFVMIRVSDWLNTKLSPVFLEKTISRSALTNSPMGSQSLRDVTQIRTFLTGSGGLAFLDLPWSFIFIAVIFMIHPVNGMITLASVVVIIGLALLTEWLGTSILSKANEGNVANMRAVEMISRNAEVIEAMGMTEQVVKNWQKNEVRGIEFQNIASYRASVITNISRFFRMVLQIALIGAGAYLALKHEITTGGIIACSIIAGRALAPFEAAMGSWKMFVDARKSYERLSTLLKQTPDRKDSMSLPVPKGNLSLENVLYAPPGTQKVIVSGIRFSLNAGEILGLVGPSAAGKSTLAKLIMGVWKPTGGVVRLDGADVFTWNRREFGSYVGYLPQGVELFEGTIRENIARLNPDAKAEDVVAAAQAAQVHEMILRLPNGYETEIGAGGSGLSAGQRQRIGLARAFYGDPKLILLDEPNSNLDQEGEMALQEALLVAKKRNITTIIIAHRPAVLAVVDKILVLKAGTIASFGSRDEILSQLIPQPPASQAKPQPHAPQPTARALPPVSAHPSPKPASSGAV
ncbi:MAG: type secretion system ATPase family protein [Rickettsiales bacterium]|nr:type secretion system ATPase family protein [Rickettsiales bacterium]